MQDYVELKLVATAFLFATESVFCKCAVLIKFSQRKMAKTSENVYS